MTVTKMAKENVISRMEEVELIEKVTSCIVRYPITLEDILMLIELAGALGCWGVEANDLLREKLDSFYEKK